MLMWNNWPRHPTFTLLEDKIKMISLLFPKSCLPLQRAPFSLSHVTPPPLSLTSSSSRSSSSLSRLMPPTHCHHSVSELDEKRVYKLWSQELVIKEEKCECYNLRKRTSWLRTSSSILPSPSPASPWPVAFPCEPYFDLTSSSYICFCVLILSWSWILFCYQTLNFYMYVFVVFFFCGFC